MTLTPHQVKAPRQITDACQGATLVHANGEPRYLTLQEAFVAWASLPEFERSGASVRTFGKEGAVYNAAELDRLRRRRARPPRCSTANSQISIRPTHDACGVYGAFSASAATTAQPMQLAVTLAAATGRMSVESIPRRSSSLSRMRVGARAGSSKPSRLGALG
jgi:hypothetical protein